MDFTDHSRVGSLQCLLHSLCSHIVLSAYVFPAALTETLLPVTWAVLATNKYCNFFLLAEKKLSGGLAFLLRWTRAISIISALSMCPHMEIPELWSCYEMFGNTLFKCRWLPILHVLTVVK